MSSKFEQVAGHASSLIRLSDGKIIKKTIDREVEFYKYISDSDSPFLRFIPKFYGFDELDGHKCIIIQDLTAGFSKPSIMDVKLGSTSADPRDGVLKQLSMRSKDIRTTTSTLGMRICGLFKHDIKNNTIVKKDKSWGKSIDRNSMLEALKFYFFDGQTICLDAVSEFIDQLKEHLLWWEQNLEFHLISASLLFVYESDPVKPTRAVVKMIDFAHNICPEERKYQDDIVFGLRNLINFFVDILDGAL